MFKMDGGGVVDKMCFFEGIREHLIYFIVLLLTNIKVKKSRAS